MLKHRILSTLKFFNLQDYPLTLLEMHKFLTADINGIKEYMDSQGDLTPRVLDLAKPDQALIDKILACLETECQNEVKNLNGFYFLSGRSEIVGARLENYFYGIAREKLIKRHIKFLKYLPFIRGVALAGSQAMGQQKDGSDIDLLIITAPKFLWLARTLITGYFQIIGKRRYGKHISNRFCLNHYLVNPKKISQLRNFYTAAEYLKLRPMVGDAVIGDFKKANSDWIKIFFPNAVFTNCSQEIQPKIQRGLEEMFSGKFGAWLEQRLKNWQLPKIRQEKFILVADDELSFHPQSKQQFILRELLKLQN